MATSIVALPAPTSTDARTDIKNARLAYERLDAVIAALKTQREVARSTFLRTVAADLAGLKDVPTKAFTDAEFAKCTAAENADKELHNRIAAFENLVPQVDEYIEELAEKYRADFIELLTEERAALEAQREKEDADKAVLESRIEAIDAQLAKWSGKTARSTARKPKAASVRKSGRK